MSEVWIDPDYQESDDDRFERLVSSLEGVVLDAKGLIIPVDEAHWLGAEIRKRCSQPST